MTMIVVTGASGFVGRETTAALLRAGENVKVCVRKALAIQAPALEQTIITDIASVPDWRPILHGAKAVLHLAGSAHSDPVGNAEAQARFISANVLATAQLARAAAAAGVARFVFVSSIGVHGTHTVDKSFSAEDQPAPADFYAQTKLEAESALHEAADRSPMEAVIVRPTLVAGPGAPGNLSRLARLIQRRIPLPIGRIHNSRSLIGLRSLADLLVLCCVHPAAAGRVFVAADDPPLSTAEIVREIANGLGTAARIWKVPSSILELTGLLTGRSRDITRMCGSLLVDAKPTREALGWQQKWPIQAELRALGAELAQLS